MAAFDTSTGLAERCLVLCPQIRHSALDMLEAVRGLHRALLAVGGGRPATPAAPTASSGQQPCTVLPGTPQSTI